MAYGSLGPSGEPSDVSAEAPAASTLSPRRDAARLLVVGLALLAVAGATTRSKISSVAGDAAAPSSATLSAVTPPTPLEEAALAPAPAAAQTAPPTQYREFTNTALRNKTIGMFKRTHACTSATKDVWFQQRVLGLSKVTLMLSGESGYGGGDDDAVTSPTRAAYDRYC